MLFVTGLCYGQDPSEYSDCTTLSQIMQGPDQCESLLEYLKTLSSNSYNYLQTISHLKDPYVLLVSEYVDMEKVCK
jgi:hypothetical protein